MTATGQFLLPLTPFSVGTDTEVLEHESPESVAERIQPPMGAIPTDGPATFAETN
jgi:hypothetical protein